MKSLQEVLEFIKKIEPFDIIDDKEDEEKLTNSFNYVLEQVGEDEDIKFAFWCLRNVMLGHNAVLVTDKRIICGQNENVRGRIFTQAPLLETVPLEEIKDIRIKPQQWSFGPVGGFLMLDTGEDTVRYMFPRVKNKLLVNGVSEPVKAIQDAGLIDLIKNLKSAIKNDNQVETVAQNPLPNDKQLSAADEIMKYKQLLDVGAITQEEFDKKKKQLLGL